MNYKIEIDVPENKLNLVLEFLSGVSFIKNLKTIAPKEITNPKVLRSIEAYEKGDVHPTSMSLSELKTLLNA